MAEYEQMEMDFTLERDRNLKTNIETVAKFAGYQLEDECAVSTIRNKHEAYGVAAENFSKLGATIKNVSTDMGTFLKILQSQDADCVSVAGSLYNSSIEVAQAAIVLAAHANRIMNDLYYKTPVEEYIEEAGRG